MATPPRVLIEEWLPVAELGIESRREAAPIPGQFPKLKTLHVWWARRPLAASAGVVLGSVMPAWSPALSEAVIGSPELSTSLSYRAWFLRLCGILGDPVAAKAKSRLNKERGIQTVENPYDYRPAFKNRPRAADVDLLHKVLRGTWGELPTVLDPTAGGGSIPFQAIRFGFETIANDLNPVAASILRASVETPARSGSKIAPALREWGERLVGRVAARLSPYFPAGPGEEVFN